MVDEGNGSFERGFTRAIIMFRDGITWELITHEADLARLERGEEYSRGMVASVEAMNGWEDIARREARAFGISPATIERLLGEAREAWRPSARMSMAS